MQHVPIESIDIWMFLEQALWNITYVLMVLLNKNNLSTKNKDVCVCVCSAHLQININK